MSTKTIELVPIGCFGILFENRASRWSFGTTANDVQATLATGLSMQGSFGLVRKCASQLKWDCLFTEGCTQ